jgi:hypothetical protein
MKELTERDVQDFLKSYTIIIKSGPFRKLTTQDGLFFVYDEDGKIKKATAHLHQALKAYNAL